MLYMSFENFSRLEKDANRQEVVKHAEYLLSELQATGGLGIEATGAVTLEEATSSYEAKYADRIEQEDVGGIAAKSALMVIRALQALNACADEKAAMRLQISLEEAIDRLEGDILKSKGMYTTPGTRTLEEQRAQRRINGVLSNVNRDAA